TVQASFAQSAPPVGRRSVGGTIASDSFAAQKSSTRAYVRSLVLVSSIVPHSVIVGNASVDMYSSPLPINPSSVHLQPPTHSCHGVWSHDSGYLKQSIPGSKTARSAGCDELPGHDCTVIG